MYRRFASVRERPDTPFQASLQHVNVLFVCIWRRTTGTAAYPYHFSLARFEASSSPRGLSIIPSTSPSIKSLAQVVVCDLIRGGRHTHALLVEPIELQSRHSRRLLGASANFVDGVERMAEDSVCRSTCCQQAVRRRRQRISSQTRILCYEVD